jgi:hypothetical protein
MRKNRRERFKLCKGELPVRRRVTEGTRTPDLRDHNLIG